MELRAPLSGLYVPLVTPFTSDLHLDVTSLESLAHEALDNGATGLVVLGTTAESAALDEQEKRTVLAVCSAVCRERGATVIVGAGGNNTRRAADELRELAARGDVDAALVPTPPFTRPGEDGVVAHFAELAGQGRLPIVVYNIPYRTGQALSADALRRLAALPGVVGVKHAVGSIDADTVDLLSDPPADFAVLGGDDLVLSPLLAMGADGGIVASAGLRTGDFVELVQAWHADDAGTARDLGAALAPLSAALFAEPNPIVLKGVLHAEGRIRSAAVRLPLLPAHRSNVDRALRHLPAHVLVS